MILQDEELQLCHGRQQRNDQSQRGVTGRLGIVGNIGGKIFEKEGAEEMWL